MACSSMDGSKYVSMSAGVCDMALHTTLSVIVQKRRPTMHYVPGVIMYIRDIKYYKTYVCDIVQLTSLVG